MYCLVSKNENYWNIVLTYMHYTNVYITIYKLFMYFLPTFPGIENATYLPIKAYTL